MYLFLRIKLLSGEYVQDKEDILGKMINLICFSFPSLFLVNYGNSLHRENIS